MKITISANQFAEIIKRGYSTDHIILLKLIDENSDIAPLCESVKVAMLHQTLIRKGLINDEGNKLTTLGQELIVFIDTKDSTKLPKKKTDVEGFDKWWATYPPTDSFEYKGRTFIGCRTLRQNKEECRIKFNKIILEGQYTISDLIDSLNYDVTQKKEMSVKTGSNKLTYLQNSLTYLRQFSFEPYIELAKSGNKINTENNTFDGVNL